MLSTYFLLSSIVCDAICELNGKGIFNSTEFSGLLLLLDMSALAIGQFLRSNIMNILLIARIMLMTLIFYSFIYNYYYKNNNKLILLKTSR